MKKCVMLLTVFLLAAMAGPTACMADALAPIIPAPLLHGMDYVIPAEIPHFTSLNVDTQDAAQLLIHYKGINSGSLVEQDEAGITMNWWDGPISAVYFPYTPVAGDQVINVAYTTLAGLPACYLEQDRGDGGLLETYILAASDGYFNIACTASPEFLTEGKQIWEQFLEGLDNQGGNKPDSAAQQYVSGKAPGKSAPSPGSSGGGGCDAGGGVFGVLALSAFLFKKGGGR